MAGFFGIGDFTKEGPGVDKNGPKKSRVTVFFEILLRKFWSLIRINIMYFIFNIPALIIAFFITNTFLLPYLMGPILQDAALMAELFGEDGIGLIILVVFVMGMITAFPIITTGPAHAGLTFILRNYAREEHAFIWSEFKEHAMKNLKQSIIISIINMFVFVLLIFQLYFYNNYQGIGLLGTIASGIVVVMLLLFLMTIMYIYPLMVTFKLSIKQLYKNALIFSIMRFIPNILILIICAGFIFASFYFQPLIGIVLFPLFTLSFVNFLTNFHVYPKMKKFIIDKMDPEELGNDVVVSSFKDDGYVGKKK